MPKGFATLGILVVIVLLLTLGGGLLVWQKILILPIRPTPTPDPTVNWKFYTSENLKFTVKYPPNLYLDQDSLTSYSINEARKKMPTGNFLNCNFVYYDPELVNIKSLTVLKKGPPLVELLVAKDKDLPIDSDAGLFNFYRISQDQRPRIGFLCMALQDPAQNQTINQILSTFKFLDRQTNDKSTGTCIPKFKVEAGPELTASGAYQYRCTEQQNEAGCKLVDIYSESSKTFGDADGTPDCQWVTSAN